MNTRFFFSSFPRVKDQRQATVQLPATAVEHMQALVSRAEVGPDSRVMDVGTGTGILLRFLQASGVRQVRLRTWIQAFECLEGGGRGVGVWG